MIWLTEPRAMVMRYKEREVITVRITPYLVTPMLKMALFPVLVQIKTEKMLRTEHLNPHVHKLVVRRMVVHYIDSIAESIM